MVVILFTGSAYNTEVTDQQLIGFVGGPSFPSIFDTANTTVSSLCGIQLAEQATPAPTSMKCQAQGEQCGGANYKGVTACCKDMICLQLSTSYSECNYKLGPPWVTTVTVVGDDNLALIDTQDLANNFQALFKDAHVSNVQVGCWTLEGEGSII